MTVLRFVPTLLRGLPASLDRRRRQLASIRPHAGWADPSRLLPIIFMKEDPGPAFSIAGARWEPERNRNLRFLPARPALIAGLMPLAIVVAVAVAELPAKIEGHGGIGILNWDLGAWLTVAGNGLGASTPGCSWIGGSVPTEI